jgi:hypothetical protein
MTCYTMIIKEKSHKEVLDIVDKVITNKKPKEWGANELKLSASQFEELYSDVMKHVLVI